MLRKRKQEQPTETLAGYLAKLIKSFEESNPNYHGNQNYRRAVQVQAGGDNNEIAKLFLDLVSINWDSKRLTADDEIGMVTMLDLLAAYRRERK